MFEKKKLSSMYIDDFILIREPMFNNYFKKPTLKALIITKADNIFCNSSCHFG